MSSPFEVFTLRKQLWSNGFRPVAVLSGSKKPFANGWPERARANPPADVVEWPSDKTLSTGLLCDGLRAIDLDLDDVSIASQVRAIAWRILGPAPCRERANSFRCLLLYRALGGEPLKRAINGSLGKVEALGTGQQIVAFGLHPTGEPYTWSPGASPVNFSVSVLPVVSEEAVSSFLEAVAPLIGAHPPKAESVQFALRSSQAGQRDVAYARTAFADEAGKLATLRAGDGRNAALNASAFVLGTLVGNGSLDPEAVMAALFDAATANGHLAKHGESQTRKTIESGLNSGISKPRATLTVDGPEIDIAAIKQTSLARSKPIQTKGIVQRRRSVTLMNGSEIEAKPITWLWDGYLSSGKLTLLAGAGGTGKSTLAFSIAGTITNGGTWPDGSRCSVPGNVLIWSSEDDPADTIKPRLMAVGANQSRYRVINGTIDEQGHTCPFDAAVDMDGLQEAVRSIGGISLLIIDPIVGAVTGDMHKANDVRRSLQPIVDFAAEMECAVLGITHFAKGTAGKNSAERVIGSQAFAALARMVLVAAKEEDLDRRVFTRAKSNNSLDTGGFAYAIEPSMLDGNIVATRVVWGEALEGSSRSILSGVEDGDANQDNRKITQAKSYLLKYLAHGPVASNELIDGAKEELGICVNTLRKA